MALFTVSAAPLPQSWRGTPQQLLEAFLDRLEITSDLIGFIDSDSPPDHNDGVWLKNGSQIWVWSDEDGGAYVPLDISASYTPQIFVGEDTPDPDKFQLWLRLDGLTVLGLYAYLGSTAGWVAQVVVPDGSITTAKLADSAVTTPKIQNLAVTAEKLANVLDLSAKTVTLPTNAIQDIFDRGFWQSSNDFIIAASGVTASATHTLNRVPKFFVAYLVALEDNPSSSGYGAGDLLDVNSLQMTTSSGDNETIVPAFIVSASDTHITVTRNDLRTGNTIDMFHKTTGARISNFDTSKWKIRLVAA